MEFADLIKTPEFFDIFGLPIFTFILIIGVNSIIRKKKLPKWMGVALILIGIAGIMVDGIIVFTTFFR